MSPKSMIDRSNRDVTESRFTAHKTFISQNFWLLRVAVTLHIMMKVFALAALVGVTVAQPNSPELQTSRGNLVRQRPTIFFRLLGNALFSLVVAWWSGGWSGGLGFAQPARPLGGESICRGLHAPHAPNRSAGSQPTPISPLQDSVASFLFFFLSSEFGFDTLGWGREDGNGWRGGYTPACGTFCTHTVRRQYQKR